MDIEELEMLKESADGGDAEACFKLAVLLYDGEELPQDSKRAFKYFSVAEKAGNARAAYFMGLCYYYGQGEKISDDKAHAMFERAAAGGCEEAKIALSKLEFIEHDLIVRAQGGDEDACCRLGAMYEDMQYHTDVNLTAYIWAAKWYERAAEKDNIQALLWLGNIYSIGWGVGRDEERSARYRARAFKCASARVAADGNDCEAKFYLGKCFYYGFGCNRDEAAGLKLVTVAADGGLTEALYAIADGFGEEKGTDTTVAHCHQILERLAEVGDSQLKRSVAGSYEYGGKYRDGVPAKFCNEERAFYWRERAAELGDVKAQFSVAEKYRKTADRAEYLASTGEDTESNTATARDNYKKALYWYGKAAENGYLIAGSELAEFYVEGKWVEKDYARAVEMLKPPARCTDGKKFLSSYYSTAAELLGDIYSEGGHGVERDDKKAFNWYLSAARRDNKRACTKVGNAFFNGVGTERNYEKAAEWYEKAVFDYDEVFYYGSEEGYDYAANVGLGDCYRHGLGVRKDEEYAFHLYHDVAKYTNDCLLADVRVAECYYYGIGVEKNVDEAKSWLEGAAKNGSEEAKAVLKKYFGNQE